MAVAISPPGRRTRPDTLVSVIGLGSLNVFVHTGFAPMTLILIAGGFLVFVRIGRLFRLVLFVVEGRIPRMFQVHPPPVPVLDI